MKKRITLLLILLLFLCTNMFSQEETETYSETPRADNFFPPESQPNPIVETSETRDFTQDSIFVINSINFNIKGFTRPSALLRKGELVTGEEIKGFLELEKYIAEKRQVLYNERVLDSVSIDHIIGEAREDGKFPVDLTINTNDTWNIVAIPRPRYDSNSGFDLTIKARDYNFLGTMAPLRLDLGYIYDENGQSSFLFMLDSNIPFTAFGLDWGLKFVNDFTYRPDTEEPFYFRNTTGLYVDLPFKTTTFTLGFDESFLVNEEISDDYKPLYGNFQKGLYMKSEPYVSWEIPTGVNVGKWGELTYTPALSAVFFHEFQKWPVDETKKGPSLVFKHNLGFDRVDWIGNLKKGFDASFYNSFSYDFFKFKNEKNPWSMYFNLTGVGHFIITDFFGISTRLMYRQWIFSDFGYTQAGDALRGIPDGDVAAENILSLNLDFTFRVLRFKPSVWFNTQKMRIFNFDLHLTPIFDAAIFNVPVNNTGKFNNALITGGVEFIIFPEFFRSLYLRISIASNITDYYNGRRNTEVFIGTDFHY